MKSRYLNLTVITEMKLIRRNLIMMLAGVLCLSLTIPLAGCYEDADDPEHGEEGHEHEEGEEDGHDHEEAEEGQSDEHEGHSDEEGHEEEHPEEVSFTPVAMKEAGINVERVMRQQVVSTISAPGRVVPTQYGTAHVGTLVAGRITRLHVTEGSYVSKGTPLAEIEAFDIGQLKGEYARALADVEQRRLALTRQEKLVAEGIGAERSREEAESEYGQAVALQKAAAAKLRAAGIEPSSVKGESFSSRLTIRSPIAGIVSRREVVLGEYLDPSADAFEIMNNSTVWVDAQVSPAIASSIGIGRAGFVRGPKGDRRSGRVIFISPSVDPDSRTVTVRVEVSNPDGSLRPETFVSVSFERSVSELAIAIPKTAVENEEDRHYVYREHEPNTFQRIEVEIGGETGENVVVRKGLEEDERIAVTGIFYLRSARLKGELQEHHH